MDRRLIVSMSGVRVGVLSLKENGNMQFRYEPDYRGPALSVALPVKTDAYPHAACVAWFGGLLPEGDVRRALAGVLGLSEQNQFRILNEIGGDCAGAITLMPEEWSTREPASVVKELTAEDLDDALTMLPRRPLAADPQSGIRMSLAGAQPKLPVIYEPTRYPETGFAIPESSIQPTTHIVKPEPDRFPGLVDTEMYCMTLARAVGMPVAFAETGATLSGLRYLIVRRYDRTHGADSGVERLHQEDFCQALLIRSEDKYQQHGGPSFAQLAETIRRCSRTPRADLFALWDAAVFNWAIGNCDAHAKNFSLLYRDLAPTLAPLYDLVSTYMYPELDTRVAMTIGGARQLGEVDAGSWVALARDMRISPNAAVERAEELLALIKHHAPLVTGAIDPYLDKISVRIERRIGEIQL